MTDRHCQQCGRDLDDGAYPAEIDVLKPGKEKALFCSPEHATKWHAASLKVDDKVAGNITYSIAAGYAVIYPRRGFHTMRQARVARKALHLHYDLEGIYTQWQEAI